MIPATIARMVRRVFAAYRIVSVVVPSLDTIVRRACSSRLKKGVDAGDVALLQPQFGELGEDEGVEPMPVGVCGGVLTPLSDLRSHTVAASRYVDCGSEQLGALAAALAQLVLQGALCRGP